MIPAAPNPSDTHLAESLHREVNYSARRINTLAQRLGVRRYLEIGVSHGITFCDVKVEHRVAVDRKFRFNTRQHENPRTRFIEMTSDDYCIRNAAEPPFDLIFIDGLHTFEQTCRDFNNALMLAHPRTVYLIDDTVPSDVYSALPVAEETFKYREETGDQGRAWHGDVYKLVFLIHDFFPLLSYATIMSSGNPQTLVWRAPRTQFKPKFNSLEAISRLTWFDFRREFSLLNPLDETSAIELAVGALGA